MKATRIFDLLEGYSQIYSDKDDALVAKENKQWTKYSAKTYVESSELLSYGLLEMGLKKGDKIASVSNNRPEWNFIDMAMSQLGIIHIPIYPTVSNEDFLYILNHAEPKLLLVSDKSLYQKLSVIVKKVETIKDIYSFNLIENVKNWKDILDFGKENKVKFSGKLSEIKDSIKPHDLTTIIYTSGTTGNPKGVMLSHNNILSNMHGIGQVFSFTSKDRTLSFLPISHIFERTINYYFQNNGLSIYYAESLGTISSDLQEVKPNVFISVPRVLEKIYDRIIGKGKDLKGIKKQLFFWAVNLGLKYDFEKKQSLFYRLQLNLANKIIFKKWREAIGGEVRLLMAGGAAIQHRLVQVFNAARIPLVEGYGMTETSPVIAASDYDRGKVRLGTVGPVLPGVEVKIDADGEILVKGPSVMLGYYKEPKLTKEILDENGWLHTGDVGMFVDNEYLKITDRKKEIFKLSSGKYVAPQAIENKFKESIFIEQIFVFGENQKFASAIISPNFSFLHNWCSIHKVKYRDNVDLIVIPEVIQRFQKEVNLINKQFGAAEHIKRFKLVHEEWSTITGELSPTLKLKRRFLTAKYKPLIEEIFAVDNVGK